MVIFDRKDCAERLRRTCQTIMTRAEALQEAIKEEEESKRNGEKNKKKKSGGDADSDQGMTAEQKEMRKRLEDTLVAPSEELSWSDVAGLEDAKQSLEEAVILPQKFPQLFTGKRKPWKGILLYGPPGTGKSFIARVLSSISKMNFFSISASSLMSKWVGESEKMVCFIFNTTEIYVGNVLITMLVVLGVLLDKRTI